MTRRLALVALAGLLGLACFSLDSFLFDPDRIDEYLRPEDMDEAWHVRLDVIPDSLIEPVVLTSSGGNRIYGFFVRRPETGVEGADQASALAIYAHGFGENINRYWGRVELLWEAGCRVFIYDYQGYGRSEGSPSGDACHADAKAALEYCRSRPDVTDSLVLFYGWSLGSFMSCYSATDLCRDTIPYLGLVLETPMASVSAVAREGALLDIPGSFLTVADFDNEARIGRVGRPVLVLWSDADETAVPERNAAVLLDIARHWQVDVTDSLVESAAHDGIPETMGYNAYREVVREFIARCRDTVK